MNGDELCQELQEVLDALGADRMVVGHTPKNGDFYSKCGNRFIVIDIAISRNMGGPMAGNIGYLQIEKDLVQSVMIENDQREVTDFSIKN